MTDDDLLRALAEARRDRTPPPELEAATVAALRSRGLFDGRRSGRPRRTLLQAAAIAAAVLVGVWIGETRTSRPAPTGPRFLLLLYEDATFQTTDGAGNVAREAEYTAWIRKLAKAGHGLDGEKLDWGGAELQANRPASTLKASQTSDQAHGYFIIAAADAQAALAIAETCPHLKYGGRIEMRAISP
jgi:hypothetical protein